MFNLLLSVYKFHNIFPILFIFYSMLSFINLVRLTISFLPKGLKGNVGSSGRLYSFFIIGIVWFCLSPENPISINFFGFRDRW